MEIKEEKIENNKPRQYYKFNACDAFPENTIFERNGDEFTPIMGAWTEDGFKERSGGNGFDKIKKLNTTFDEVMKVNPTWKQKGVILPKDLNYEIYGNPNSKHFEKISEIMSKISPTKKYKFNFTQNFDKTLDGSSTIMNSDIDPAYKKLKEDNKNSAIGGASGDMGDYFEVMLDPENIEYSNILVHEIGHTIFDRMPVPDNLFTTNRTSGCYESFDKMGEKVINKRETLADHFVDYTNDKERYTERYPEEAKFFDNFLRIIK